MQVVHVVADPAKAEREIEARNMRCRNLHIEKHVELRNVGIVYSHFGDHPDLPHPHRLGHFLLCDDCWGEQEQLRHLYTQLISTIDEIPEGVKMEHEPSVVVIAAEVVQYESSDLCLP